MTHRKAERLLEEWRRRLVPEWTVALDWDATPDSADARLDVVQSTDYHHATVRTCPGWLECDAPHPGDDADAEREIDLVHELLHLLLRDLEQAARQAANGLGDQAHNLARAAWKHALEGAIERMARAMVDAGPQR